VPVLVLAAELAMTTVVCRSRQCCSRSLYVDTKPKHHQPGMWALTAWFPRGPGKEGNDAEPTELSLLYKLVQSGAWEEVTLRCTSHPHEASPSVVDAHGDNALHRAAFAQAPLATIQALLRASPELASRPNQKQQYPLHGKHHFINISFIESLVAEYSMHEYNTL
jgi:hypothetical protein